MKRRFLIPGHPEQHIEADHMYSSNTGMIWFINGDYESFLYDDEQNDPRYTVIAQFQAGVLILPGETP